MEKSLDYHNQALNISMELGEDNETAIDHGNIGLVYNESGQYEKAEEYFCLSLNRHTMNGNRREEVNQLLNIGDTWKRRKNEENAKVCYENAYSTGKEINHGIFATLERLAEMYNPENFNIPDEEIKFTCDLIDRCEKLEKPEREIRYFERIIDIYERQQSVFEKNKYLVKFEALLQRNLLSTKTPEDIYKKLISVYKGLGKRDKELEYEQKYNNLNIQQLNIWLPPGAAEERDGTLVLSAGYEYRFNIMIGDVIGDYSWIKRKEIKTFKGLPDNIDSYELAPIEGRRLSSRNKSEQGKKNTETAMDSTVSGGIVTKGKAGKLKKQKSKKKKPVQEKAIPDNLDNKPSIKVVFKFDASSTGCNKKEETLRLYEKNRSGLLSISIVPEITGKHRFTITGLVDSEDFRVELDIPIQVEEPVVPANLKPAWDLFTSNDRNTITRITDSSQWNSCWEELLLAPKPVVTSGITPSQWRIERNKIKKYFEEKKWVVNQHKDLDKLADEDATFNKPGNIDKRPKIDRIKAFEQLNKMVDSIRVLLQKGGKNLSKARIDVDQFVEIQQKQGDKNELISKTLCNVAAIAKNYNHYDWAEELHRKSLHLYYLDEVAHSGLADVLKRQGKLKGAEVVYRETVERWPDSEYARSGLTGLLKR